LLVIVVPRPRLFPHIGTRLQHFTLALWCCCYCLTLGRCPAPVTVIPIYDFGWIPTFTFVTVTLPFDYGSRAFIVPPHVLFVPVPGDVRHYSHLPVGLLPRYLLWTLLVLPTQHHVTVVGRDTLFAPLLPTTFAHYGDSPRLRYCTVLRWLLRTHVLHVTRFTLPVAGYPATHVVRIAFSRRWFTTRCTGTVTHHTRYILHTCCDGYPTGPVVRLDWSKQLKTVYRFGCV